MSCFADLNLAPPLAAGLAAAHFQHCTPIQALSLPLSLAGQDVAGQAQTGTGKTAAFLVALYQRLLQQTAPEPRLPNQIRALILAPTRELAAQIEQNAQLLGQACALRLGLAYGGKDYRKQMSVLQEGVDILIATPGRLLDFVTQKQVDLRRVEVLVLDEADRMFDLGFIQDIRRILRRLPPPTTRLSLLFSATLSNQALELAYEHMNNPQVVRVTPEAVTASNVQERIYYTANLEKIPLLLSLLPEATRSIVFTNTKRSAETVWRYLQSNGYPSALLSGDIPQHKRERLLAQFQQGELAVLVATDVAARGLHIPEVSHVINFDLPQQPEDYVHRIGRTARLGRSGIAVSFACEDTAFTLPDIEAYIGHKIPAHPVLTTQLTHPQRPFNGELNKLTPQQAQGKARSAPPRRARQHPPHPEMGHPASSKGGK